MKVNKPWIRFVTDDHEDGGGSDPTPNDDQNQGSQEDSKDDDSGDDREDEDGDEDSAGEWDRERAMRKIRKSNQEAKSQRERAKAAEEKAKQASDFEKRALDAEARLLRLEVGADVGLPKSLASRLQGSTKEELLADAEELMKLVAPSKPSGKPKPNLKGGAKPSEDDGELSAAEIVKRAKGRL